MWRMVLAGLALAALTGPAVGQTVREGVEKPVQQAIGIHQAAQKAQEAWRDERQAQVELYEALQQDEARLAAEKDRLVQECAARQERIAEKTRGLAGSQEIARQIEPFLGEIVALLRRRLEADLPFLTAERTRRADSLERLLADPGVTVSEKFRKALEALMVEAEYGGTVEVYQETIEVEGRPLLVNVFRLGRMSLFFQTLDRQQSGSFHVAQGTWTPLPAAFNTALETAIEIGAKRRSVELLRLPLGRMAVQ
jgi:hypothetical protein